MNDYFSRMRRLLSHGTEMEVPRPSSESVPEPSQPSSAASQSLAHKRSNKATSPVWNYFQRCNSDGAYARWLVCNAKYQHSNNTSNLAKVRLRSNMACWLPKECLWLSFLASPSQACDWMQKLWRRKERDGKGRKETWGNHPYNPANISICDQEKEWVSKRVVVITFDVCCWDCMIVCM